MASTALITLKTSNDKDVNEDQIIKYTGQNMLTWCSSALIPSNK